jgi:ribosomal protein S27AE
MSQQIEFPPVRNGLDYLQSVIEHLHDEPSARDLKYAVLHLQAAAEVLLKVRLIRVHWSLVFRNPDKASRGSYDSGDFQSIGLEETLARLKGIVEIDLPVTARDSLRRLEKERNKLQHFGLVEQAIAIESLTGKVLDALLCFIDEHLRPGASEDDLEAFDQSQGLIREEMERIKTLVQTRWGRITPELDHNAEYVIICPGCLKLALLLDGNARCLFCGQAWDNGNDAAEEFAANILDFTWYDVMNGAESPVRACPDCGYDAFLANIVVRADPETPKWVCLSCGLTASQDAIDECVRCGELKRYYEEDGCICDSCLADLVNRD